MRSRVRSTRENRRFSSVEKRPEDFFHGQLAGCGETACGIAGIVATVTGTVTLDGQPLAAAMVRFQPASGGAPSAGTTDSSGRYELRHTRSASSPAAMPCPSARSTRHGPTPSPRHRPAPNSCRRSTTPRPSSRRPSSPVATRSTSSSKRRKKSRSRSRGTIDPAARDRPRPHAFRAAHEKET